MAALAPVLIMAAPGVTPHAARAAVPRVELREAEECAVMAGAGVSNTDITTISGDMAVSPGTAVSGFPPGQVRGSVEVDNAEARREKADAVAAYNDAARRTATSTIPAQLGRTTRPSGVYKTAGGVFQLSGTLILDAEGDPDAVFIFQAASLVTANVSNIDLVGGAQANNVIWQLSDSATLGTYSTFRGNILAQSSVAVSEGVALYGRAIALNDMVTLDGTSQHPATRITAPGEPPTTTTVTSSSNPSRRGEPVTFTATVREPTDSVVPAGQVIFKDGSTVIGSAYNSSLAPATFTTSDLTRGAHDITAVYLNGGTAVNEAWVYFTPSTSEVLTQVVLNRRS
ncbi:ice-binding family protein [Planotetraspora kaengkrachanensis]|nr:ice-binding family protein [Planotetraspora kaengkrachanensis]